MTLLLLASIIAASTFSLLFADSIVAFGLFSLTAVLLISALIGLTLVSWTGIIVLLVYVGGLIVMFAYFLAICPNQIISLNGILNNFTLILLILLSTSLLSLPLIPSWPSNTIPISSLYTSFNFHLLILLAIALFLTLVAVVNLVQLNQGPLRPFEPRQTN